MQFNKGDRVAQLLSFPYIKGKAAPVERPGGFGNTGKCVFWQAVVNDKRQELKSQVNGIEVEGLVNTGVDVTHFTNILEFRMATLEGLYSF